MKVLSFIALLCVAMIIPCAVQAQTVEGMGTWYESQTTGLYAAHATYPFGTQLTVTNPKNQKQVVVQVGGRIPEDSTWKIAVSAEAATALEMNYVGFTALHFAEVPKAPVTKAKSRAVSRKFSQIGPAIAQTAGTGNTVSHPSLPFGTKVRITNQKNRRQAEGTVNSRIAVNQIRIIELSPIIARSLSIDRTGTMVLIESVE
jgi:rare lipoprotein A (peptidoglycan hydrolase)